MLKNLPHAGRGAEGAPLPSTRSDNVGWESSPGHITKVQSSLAHARRRNLDGAAVSNLDLAHISSLPPSLPDRGAGLHPQDNSAERERISSILCEICPRSPAPTAAPLVRCAGFFREEMLFLHTRMYSVHRPIPRPTPPTTAHGARPGLFARNPHRRTPAVPAPPRPSPAPEIPAQQIPSSPQLLSGHLPLPPPVGAWYKGAPTRGYPHG
jgi:hypothetical protein